MYKKYLKPKERIKSLREWVKAAKKRYKGSSRASSVESWNTGGGPSMDTDRSGVWVCSRMCLCFFLFASSFREYERIKVEKTFTEQLLAWEHCYFLQIFSDIIPNPLCLQNIFLFITAAPFFGGIATPIPRNHVIWCWQKTIFHNSGCNEENLTQSFLGSGVAGSHNNRLVAKFSTLKTKTEANIRRRKETQ